MAEKLTGISRVRVAENNGGGSHGSGGFTGKIRPGITWVNPVSPPVSGHVLGPLPTVVVSVSISYLIIHKLIT